MFFHDFDEGCVGVACWRFCEVLFCFDGFVFYFVTFFTFWEDFFFGGSVDFHVSIKNDRTAVCAEGVVFCVEVDAGSFEFGWRHLSCDGSAPNEFVEFFHAGVGGFEIVWRDGDIGWANGFVGFLCALTFGCVGLDAFCVVCAECCADVGLCVFEE